MNWYCIHTRPAKEPQVARFFHDNLDLESYLPRLRRRQTHRRVTQIISEPLFPRYLFCRLDLKYHYRAVRYAPEVINVLGVCNHPTVVDDAIIEDLKRLVDATDTITSEPSARPGAHVEITTGPMRGLEGILQREMSDHERVSILLSTINYSASVIIDRTHLRYLAQASA